MTRHDPARFAASPRSLGYRMPAEYAPHKRTWMMWPTRAEVWPDMSATKRDYVKVARAIAEFEPLCMAVCPEDAAEARAMLGNGIELFEVPLDDSWARDAGPNFVVDGKGGKAASLFTFSAWGHKYAPFDKDAAFGAAVAARERMPVFKSPLLAEGGGVTVDGEGTIITTDTCFLNKNRNPSWTREEVTRELLETLGGEKVIWLPGNADETETDGHVDGIAEVIRRDNLPDMARFELKVPHALARFIAAKGSVTLDGVSLTVNTVEGDIFSVLIIPHHLQVTTLVGWQAGIAVNLEVDLMARYDARLTEAK